MTDDEKTEIAIRTFMEHPALPANPALAAEIAVEAHAEAANLEKGTLETDVWHLLYSMIGTSDANGFFRDQIFGPAKHGGPRLHKLAVGIQALCETKRLDYASIYADAHQERDSLDPVLPRP